MEAIHWYNYLAAFFAGVILTNAVPHFTHGISGDKFPTPFSKPHRKGLSSPMVNTLWACFNLLIGYILLRVSEVSSNDKILLSVLFIGIVSMSVFSSNEFSKKQKNNGTK
jgi:hypothetical protein